MYERGQGVPANPPRAVELYAIASQRGNNEATCHLGYAHERGFGMVFIETGGERRRRRKIAAVNQRYNRDAEE